jgi:hypothetical protein
MHTSAYVSIRQPTSGIRQPTSGIRRLAYAAPEHARALGELQSQRLCELSGVALLHDHRSGSIRLPADVSMRQHTPAHVSIRQHTSAYVSIRQHTSAYVSISQHTPAYVNICQRHAAKSTACASRS